MSKRSPPAAHWTQWTETEARAALARWSDSGLSAARFARELGVSPHRLLYWRDKLGPTVASPAVPAFVPVHLVAPAEIVLSVGEVSLRLRDDTPHERVAELLCAIVRRVRAC